MAAKAKKKGGSFVKQAAILAAASLLVRFLGFIYRLPLTNMIGDEGNAIYSGGYYIYTFLLILSSAGLPAAISKLVSERIALKQYRNAHRVFQAALVISTCFGTFFAIVMGLGAHRLADMIDIADSYYSLLTLCPTLVIVAIMSVFRGYFQGMRTMVPTAISQIVEQVFNAFFSVYLAWVFMSINIPEGMTKNIPLASAGGTMGTGIGALAGLVVVVFAYCLIRPYLLWRAERCKQPYEESKRELMGRVLQTAWPIIAGTAVFSIINLIDMGMVVRILQQIGFSEANAKALYGQLSGKYVTLTTLPVTISTAVATAALPPMMIIRDSPASSSGFAEHCHIGKIEGAEAGTQKNDADLSHFHDYFCACSGWYQCAWAADYPHAVPQCKRRRYTADGWWRFHYLPCTLPDLYGDFAGDWTY